MTRSAVRAARDWRHDPETERVDRVLVQQVDGAASETAPGHPGAVNAGVFRRTGDQEIEFRNAHLEVVPKAAVRVGHQRTERVKVAGVERPSGSDHACVLRHYVARPPEERVPQVRPCLFEKEQIRIAQAV